ncbi:hypothetical protein V8E36_006263, partial [Tilletia maclaganii]
SRPKSSPPTQYSGSQHGPQHRRQQVDNSESIKISGLCVTRTARTGRSESRLSLVPAVEDARSVRRPRHRHVRRMGFLQYAQQRRSTKPIQEAMTTALPPLGATPAPPGLLPSPLSQQPPSPAPQEQICPKCSRAKTAKGLRADPRVCMACYQAERRNAEKGKGRATADEDDHQDEDSSEEDLTPRRRLKRTAAEVQEVDEKDEPSTSSRQARQKHNKKTPPKK